MSIVLRIFYRNPMMENHELLVCSSFLFLIPVYLLICISQKGTYEFLLMFLVSCNFLFSVLFWSNPVKFSKQHIWDAFFARLTGIYIFLYVVCLKGFSLLHKLTFFLNLMSTMILIYFSDYYSSMFWCSQEHVYSHFAFHLLIIFGTLPLVAPEGGYTPMV
jgi:hypothetical protein